VGFGNPTPSVTWNTQGALLSSSSQITIYEELVNEDGVDFVPSILAICSVEEANGGQYICTVGNTLGNVSVNFEVFVTVTGGMHDFYNIAFLCKGEYNVSICISPRRFLVLVITYFLHRPTPDCDQPKPNN